MLTREQEDKIKATAFFAVASFIFMVVIATFVTWGASPAEWTKGGRLGFAYVTLIAMVGGGAFGWTTGYRLFTTEE